MHRFRFQGTLESSAACTPQRGPKIKSKMHTDPCVRLQPENRAQGRASGMARRGSGAQGVNYLTQRHNMKDP
jgi:hypothetical protein